MTRINKMTKNAILIAFIAILFAGCATQKRCLRRFPPAGKTEYIERVHDSIVYRDTTILIRIAGQKQIDSIPVPCPPPPLEYIPDTAYAETSLALAKAWYNYPNIKLLLVQKDTSLKRQLNDAVKEAYHWKSEYEKKTVITEPVKFIPGVYKVAFWLWIFIIVSIIGLLVLKYKTGFFKN
jgi:hypothetical protein